MREFKTSKRAFHKAMGMFHSSVEFFLCSLNVIIIGFGGYYVMQGEMDYRDLLTFSLYISSFISPMRKLANFSETFANGFAGLNRFVEVMRTEPTVQDKPDAKELKNVRGEIRVDHVFCLRRRFGGASRREPDRRPRGNGRHRRPSGGGKSTLCQLIPRFYDVSSGSISIDGLDIRDVTQRSIHENIGIVQQDVFLFADTILENIRYGKPDATMEQVIDAAKKAEIYDDIQAMPDGFNTYVGEQGYASFRRAEAADRHCPYLPEKPAHPDSGRGDLRAGLRDGGENPARLRQAGGRTDDPDHRPPLKHHPQRRPHHLDFRRRHHGMRHPRRTA